MISTVTEQAVLIYSVNYQAGHPPSIAIARPVPYEEGSESTCV
jgi:hypothetical protein